MKNKKYTLGLDFGTLSARCVIADENGRDVGEASVNYPHGVMDKKLPSGVRLPERFALQHPSDYLFAAKESIRLSLSGSGLTPDDIVGIGIDFTGCTLLAIDEELTPLCLKDEFKDEPHAYVKLWKHYGAMAEGEKINALARERKEPWLSIYGGCTLSEWMFPKILETLNKAPAVFDATYRFVDAGDWLTWLITGEETHSVSFVGFKGLWNEESGYPSDDFFTALSPKLSGIVGTKVSDKIISVAERAGYVSERGAELLGLRTGIAVATPVLDAHAAMPALGLSRVGELMMIVGTSTVHTINATERKSFGGYLGCVRDALIPGLYTYEAGQAAVGDAFDWFIKNCVPASYEREAAEAGISIHKLLREKAKSLEVGESGLIALDWHNGNRSPLSDAALSSMMLGMKLTTRPEEIYRAWLEASAFGTRAIIENFENNGVSINRIVAAGGIALKDDLFMQIFADVSGKDIEVSTANQAGAFGSAALAAVAAGIYPDIVSASDAFAKPIHKIYKPIEKNREMYTKLYKEYMMLLEYFAKGGNDVMKRLMNKT